MRFLIPLFVILFQVVTCVAQEPSAFERAMRMVQEATTDESLKKKIEEDIQKHREKNPPKKPEAIPEMVAVSLGSPVTVKLQEPSAMEVRIRMGSLEGYYLISNPYSELVVYFVSGGSGETNDTSFNSVFAMFQARHGQSKTFFQKRIGLVKQGDPSLQSGDLKIEKSQPEQAIELNQWNSLMVLSAEAREIEVSVDFRLVSRENVPAKKTDSIFDFRQWEPKPAY